jgi:putative ABC transport system permease protein
MNQYYGNSAYTTLISNAIDRDSADLIFNNLSSTITEIETVIISILIIMVLLIIVLISLMIINDSKSLAAILKALGYRDHQNVTSFISIYIPVILLSILASIPLAYGAISIFNFLILSGTKIYLTSHLTIGNTIISLLGSSAAFVISGAFGYLVLKKENLVERLKQ